MGNNATTEVEIFGAIYQVRGHQDPEYLQELATLVDGKMREIAQHVSTVDTAKIAILVALNLADELQKGREQYQGEREEVQARVNALTGQLKEALSG